jgi:hypothetical protein
VEQVAELPVPGDKLAAAVEHGDALGHVVECNLQNSVRFSRLIASDLKALSCLLPLLCKAVPLNEAVAKECQSARHGGELVVAIDSDGDVGLPGGEGCHRFADAAERDDD